MKPVKHRAIVKLIFIRAINVYLIGLFQLAGLAGLTADAGIVQPGEYIGGDAAFVPFAQWELGGGTFVALSSDGTEGWQTRSPRRTVNGHAMVAGGTHGLLTTGNDSGWLGDPNNNGGGGGNPAGQLGDPNSGLGASAWISYEFDDVYSLGEMQIWNWNSSATPGGGEFVGGIKDVIIDYSEDELTWTTLGQFEFPQAPDAAGYAGVVGPDFGGALAKFVVITVLNDWNHWSGNLSTKHGLGEVAFDVLTPPGANFVWDARSDWSNVSNPHNLLDIRGGQWSYHDGDDDSLLIPEAGDDSCGGVIADWKSVNGACPALTDVEGPLIEEFDEITGHGDWRIKWQSSIDGHVDINAVVFQIFSSEQRIKMILSQNGRAFNSALVPEDPNTGASKLGRDNLVEISSIRSVSINDTIEMTVVGTDADEGGNGNSNYVGASFTITEVPEPATTFDLTVIAINDDNTDSNPDSTIPTAGVTTYAAGETVNLSAPRYFNCPEVLAFDRWGGDVVDLNAINTSTVMDGSKTITVHYVDDRQCGDTCHPIIALDSNGDCLVDEIDFIFWTGAWLNCTQPACDPI